MERLTERKTSCWIKTKSGKDYTNYTQDWECIEKLNAYEDTGLTPPEIMKLKERDTAQMCKQSVFDHDGMTCTCGSDFDKDVEFRFCPWCGQRLKKWED